MSSDSDVGIDDEALEDIEEASSTASVRSSIFEYNIENGRRYHAFKAGQYFRPNDEAELDRLDLVHALLVMVNNGQLVRAPVRSNALHVLDVGTGTGIWAIEFADENPSAQVVGVDLAATVPAWVPPNVSFQIDDVEDTWTYSKKFDYIHCRYMSGSIKDWQKLMNQCIEFLQPGGWVEFQDFDINMYSQDRSLTQDHTLCRWLSQLQSAAEMNGRSLRAGCSLEKWVREAGFVNIEAVRIPTPFGHWPKDKQLKKIGLLNWTQMWEGLAGFSLRAFTQVLGYEREELELLLKGVRDDMRNPKIHALMDTYSVWGQKPMEN